jgi:hypothetical protein
MARSQASGQPSQIAAPTRGTLRRHEGNPTADAIDRDLVAIRRHQRSAKRHRSNSTASPAMRLPGCTHRHGREGNQPCYFIFLLTRWIRGGARQSQPMTYPPGSRHVARSYFVSGRATALYASDLPTARQRQAITPGARCE